MTDPIEKNIGNHGKPNKGVFLYLSPVEHTIYHSLPPEKKKLIHAIVKTLLSNPELLDNMQFWQNFILRKAFSPYTCPVCLTPFATYPALIKHIRFFSHPLKCAVCGKTFASTDMLLDHFRKKHIGI